MTRRLEQLLVLSPAACIFAGLFLGAIGWCHRWPWHTVLLSSMVPAWIFSPRHWRMGVLLSAVVLAGWLRCQVTEWYSPQYLRKLPREAASARVRLVIRQAPLGTGVLREYDAGRGMVLCDLQWMQTILEPDGSAVSGRVILEVADFQERQALRELSVGAVIEGAGVFLPPPDSDDIVNGFYGEYLQANDIRHILRLGEWRQIGEAKSWVLCWRQGLRRCRETLGMRLVRNVRSKENAQLLLALGLGMSEFIPSELRERQVVAGTVHVFAISGMHVGMAALVISLLLRWTGMPLRWQWFLTGVLDGVYVLLTGASASGIRALVMALLVLYARYRWRPPSWLNTLGLAGTTGLLANPMNVLNLGFVYSYAIVAILLLVGPICREVAAILREKEAWIPRELRHRRRTAFRIWVVNGLFVSVVAWLGGSGISMRINHRLSLAAPLVNIPLGVMVYLTLMLCPLKILLGILCPCFDSVYAWILEHAIWLANVLATCGGQSQTCVPVAQLTYWQSLLFYLALACVLTSDAPRRYFEVKSRKDTME